MLGLIYFYLFLFDFLLFKLRVSLFYWIFFLLTHFYIFNFLANYIMLIPISIIKVHKVCIFIKSIFSTHFSISRISLHVSASSAPQPSPLSLYAIPFCEAHSQIPWLSSAFLWFASPCFSFCFFFWSFSPFYEFELPPKICFSTKDHLSSFDVILLESSHW